MSPRASRAASGSPAGTVLGAFVLVLALCVSTLAAAAALTFPPLTGRVVDDAHVLSPQTQADLTAKLAALEAQTGRQLVVVTLPSLQGDDIADYGYQLGRAWGIGQKGQNTGVLFIVAPSDHKVRIEVGYGLEGVLTDALSSVILQERVLPKFRAGDTQGGVVDGTAALLEQLALPAAEAKAKVDQAGQAGPAPPRKESLVSLIFAGLILFWVISSFMGALGGRRGGASAWWLLPLLLSSGGGGSFGGGGASGSW